MTRSRPAGFISMLVFIVVKLTILALIVAGVVTAWRWVFDVFS